jgi:hypothetical protein
MIPMDFDPRVAVGIVLIVVALTLVAVLLMV